MKLAKPFFNSDNNITADNWLNSMELVQKLEKEKVSYMETISKK